MATVLIVDDEPKFAEPARRTLVRAGCVVRIVHSLEEAREYLRSSRPDAIILDILFQPATAAEFEPRGCDFLEELKKAQRTKSIPVVMYTVLGDDSVEKRCRDAGAVDYIRKNAGGRRLIEALAKAGVSLQKKGSAGPMMTGLYHAFRPILPKTDS